MGPGGCLREIWGEGLNIFFGAEIPTKVACDKDRHGNLDQSASHEERHLLYKLCFSPPIFGPALSSTHPEEKVHLEAHVLQQEFLGQGDQIETLTK